MSTTEIRQEINQYLDRLSSDRLQLVAEFLAYLADKRRGNPRTSRHPWIY